MSEWVRIAGLAEWRGESVATVRRKLPALYDRGFPRPEGGKWYLPTCRQWAMGGQTSATSHDDELMRALER